MAAMHGPNTPNAVWLRVYDISNGMAATWSQLVLGRKINGVWHTGINVYGLEYFYGGGIDCMLPSQVENVFSMEIVEIQLLGYTKKTRREFERFLLLLKDKFTPNSYDLIEWNCNHFSDACARFLLNNRGIPEDILDLPETVRSTFMGDILLRLFQKFHHGRNPINDPDHPRFALESTNQGSIKDQQTKSEWMRQSIISRMCGGPRADNDIPSSDDDSVDDSPEERRREVEPRRFHYSKRRHHHSMPDDPRLLPSQRDTPPGRRASSYTASSFRDVGSRPLRLAEGAMRLGGAADHYGRPDRRRMSLSHVAAPNRVSCPQLPAAKKSSSTSVAFAPDAGGDQPRRKPHSQSSRATDADRRDLREPIRTKVQLGKVQPPNRHSLSLRLGPTPCADFASPSEVPYAISSKHTTPTASTLSRALSPRTEQALFVFDVGQGLHQRSKASKSMDRLSSQKLGLTDAVLRPISSLQPRPSIAPTSGHRSDLASDPALLQVAGSGKAITRIAPKSTSTIRLANSNSLTQIARPQEVDATGRGRSTPRATPRRNSSMVLSGSASVAGGRRSLNLLPTHEPTPVPSPFAGGALPQLVRRHSRQPGDFPPPQPSQHVSTSPLSKSVQGKASQSVASRGVARNFNNDSLSTRYPDPPYKERSQFGRRECSSLYSRPFCEGLVKGFSHHVHARNSSTGLDCPDCSWVNNGRDLMCIKCGFDFMTWNVAAV